MMRHLQRYFVAGLLVWVPILVTVFIVKFILDLLNQSLVLFPQEIQPDTLLGFHVPGIGVLITLCVILLTGMIVGNFVGNRLLNLSDSFVKRIPLVSTIYMSVKKMMNTLFTPNGQSFRKVLLVQYPRPGMWTIAFQTGEGVSLVNDSLQDEGMVSFFVPTTPNPTSGFLLIAPRREVIELNMSVDQALKYVISLGVVQPEFKETKDDIAPSIHPEEKH